MARLEHINVSALYFLDKQQCDAFLISSILIMAMYEIHIADIRQAVVDVEGYHAGASIIRVK